MRFALELVEAVRTAWPADKAEFFRCRSSTEGWPLGHGRHRRACEALKERGVDFFDCSFGGLEGPIEPAAVPRHLPGYNVVYSSNVRREAGIRPRCRADRAVHAAAKPAGRPRYLSFCRRCCLRDIRPNNGEFSGSTSSHVAGSRSALSLSAAHTEHTRAARIG